MKQHGVRARARWLLKAGAPEGSDAVLLLPCVTGASCGCQVCMAESIPSDVMCQQRMFGKIDAFSPQIRRKKCVLKKRIFFRSFQTIGDRPDPRGRGAASGRYLK